MASGYIGKISAIVTANTSDLSRKFRQSSKEANAFAVSLRSSIDRAGTNAQKSLEKIFTPLQQLERQLKAASSRSLKLKLPLDQVRAFVSAAEAINKPLERSAGGFAKLSTEVQAALIPALNAAQALTAENFIVGRRNFTHRVKVSILSPVEVIHIIAFSYLRYN